MTANRQDEQDHPLETLFDEALEEAEGDKLRVADLLEAYGTRSFGPLIAILALFIIIPIGAIPGIPAAIGLVISIMAAQLLIGRSDPWIPEQMKRLGFDREKAERAREKAGKWLRRIDKLITRRLEWAAGDVAQWMAALLCIGLSILMVPLEVIPFGADIPAAAIVMFGLGLTARDGLLMLIGFAISAASLVLAWRWLGPGSESGTETAAMLIHFSA
ncbi:MAG: exopolysaccharide biosynthesis protein [Pacificimonas sp.]|jgi:hypothetical protein|nr:exopolysaccharide biosynthesis protein [Pacificimonas sp.]